MKKYRVKENKFYYNLDEKELETMKEVEKLTGTDYEIIDNSIPVENLIDALKDMLYEYHNDEDALQGMIRDLQQDISDNYTPTRYDPYDEFGVSPRDFV